MADFRLRQSHFLQSLQRDASILEAEQEAVIALDIQDDPVFSLEPLQFY
jgi:hypothetical protein